MLWRKWLIQVPLLGKLIALQRTPAIFCNLDGISFPLNEDKNSWWVLIRKQYSHKGPLTWSAAEIKARRCAHKRKCNCNCNRSQIQSCNKFKRNENLSKNPLCLHCPTLNRWNESEPRLKLPRDDWSISFLAYNTYVLVNPVLVNGPHCRDVRGQ